MVIIDVKPKELGIPTEAYYAVEEVIEGQQLQWTFKHFPSEIGATEAEEVGVELRNGSGDQAKEAHQRTELRAHQAERKVQTWG